MLQRSAPLPVQNGPETLMLAEHEALRSGRGQVDVGHLLLAAIELCASSRRYRAVLDAHGVTPLAVRREICTGPYRSTARMRDSLATDVVCAPATLRLLARAMYHADVARVGKLLPHHVLLAALDSVDDVTLGTAANTLEAIGVNVRRLRRAMRRATKRG
jgi:hypothetical protein